MPDTATVSPKRAASHFLIMGTLRDIIPAIVLTGGSNIKRQEAIEYAVHGSVPKPRGLDPKNC